MTFATKFSKILGSESVSQSILIPAKEADWSTQYDEMMLAPPFENFRPFKVDDIKYNAVRNLGENNLEELLTIAKVEVELKE